MHRNNPRSAFGGVRALALGLAVLTAALPGRLLGQAMAKSGVSGVVAGPRVTEAYPEFRRAREVALVSVGAGLLVAAHLVSVNAPAVPVRGLDPERISWSVDRQTIGTSSLDAHLASNWTRNAAVVLPFAMALATGPSGSRWEGFGRRSAVITQAFVLSQGLTNLGKSAIGRARPYTYVPSDDRIEDPAYDVTAPGAFASMPSGHSASAWTGATLAVTEYLLGHPDAVWSHKGGIGFLGGALAGGTSALRVEAGQHFPSDVLVGAAIGIITGVAVPMLHRGQRAGPSTSSWLEATGGLAVGTLLGSVLARRY